MIPESQSYWLTNSHVPLCLINSNNVIAQNSEELCLVNIKIEQGKISQIIPAVSSLDGSISIDLNKKIVLPCFIDVHTHLDKGHIWQRSPNSDGTFATALATAIDDGQKYWNSADLYPRMEFGLKCSYAHGTKAIRTHIDCFGKQADISLDVFQNLRSQWADKLTLQAVSLVSLDYYQTDAGVALADKIADVGGILGGVAYVNPNLDSQLDTVFQLATARNLDLDFHADENGDPNSTCRQKIAEKAIEYQFTGKIVCGHCCSLAVQSAEIVKKTIDRVREANISIVSLPMCNLYLQDRQANTTPFWRGVTKVKELQQNNIPVAFASDNCRDPFYGFGDHDVLEVFTQAVRIAHLDTPYSNWINSVTKTPADLMGLSNAGRIEVGLPADLIIFKARYFSELLSRPQSDRLVLRNGKQIDTTLPDYSELDHLLIR